MKKYLAETHPVLSAHWHPTKNGNRTPHNTFDSYSGIIWWSDHGHEWPQRLRRRVSGARCSVCSNRYIQVGVNDLATTHPELAAEWDYERNGDLTPEMVHSGMHTTVWWESHGHYWPQSLVSRKTGRACTVCTGHYVNVGINDLASQRPDIASQWHSTHNGDLTPEMVTVKSNKDVWWFHDNHEWHADVWSRTSRGYNCSICSGQQIQIGVNDLATTHPDLASQWHPTKNTLTPQEVTHGSHEDVWWLDHGHEWHAVVQDRTSGRGCAVCSGRQIQLGVNDFASQFPDLAQEWDYEKNYPLTPEMVTRGYDKHVWWLCIYNHSWPTYIYNRIGKYTSGCPKCANHGTSYPEQYLGEFFTHLGYTTVCKDRTILGRELDISLPDRNLAVEYNGLYWHSDQRKTNDYHKTKFKLCEAQCIRLIQIWEDEWITDQAAVEDKLRRVLSDPAALLPPSDVVEWVEDLSWPTPRHIWEEAGWELVGEEGPRLQTRKFWTQTHNVWDAGSRTWKKKVTNE